MEGEPHAPCCHVAPSSVCMWGCANGVHAGMGMGPPPHPPLHPAPMHVHRVCTNGGCPTQRRHANWGCPTASHAWVCPEPGMWCPPPHLSVEGNAGTGTHVPATLCHPVCARPLAREPDSVPSHVSPTPCRPTCMTPACPTFHVPHVHCPGWCAQGWHTGVMHAGWCRVGLTHQDPFLATAPPLTPSLSMGVLFGPQQGMETQACHTTLPPHPLTHARKQSTNRRGRGGGPPCRDGGDHMHLVAMWPSPSVCMWGCHANGVHMGMGMPPPPFALLPCVRKGAVHVCLTPCHPVSTTPGGPTFHMPCVPSRDGVHGGGTRKVGCAGVVHVGSGSHPPPCKGQCVEGLFSIST
jgi:hypothetical protein